MEQSVIMAFSVIPEPDLERLQLSWGIRSFRKGQLVYSEGRVIDEVLVVVTGHLLSYRLTTEGKSCTLRTIGAGDFIGEEDLLDGKGTEGYVKSVTESRCLVIPQNGYEALLLHYPTFARLRFVEMSRRLKTAERMMQELAYSTVKQRILLILTKLASEIGKARSDGLELTFNWSHHDLASMVGSTRETVTNTLSLLQKEGLIKMEGKRMMIAQQASSGVAHIQYGRQDHHSLREFPR